MTSKDLIEACDILIKLEQEFSVEEAKLSEISKEHAVRIDELDQQITTFRRNEDVDYRVFSPRNVSTGNSEKIKVLEGEKKQLEREKREADKQLSYYSGKTDMIGKVLNLLRGDLKDESEDDSATVRKSRNPFGFLDEVIVDDTVEPEEDHVTALFREANNKIKASMAQYEDINDIEKDIEEELIEEKDKENIKESVNVISDKGVPVDEVERVCHKVEFCEKIIVNDGIRAKIEIKNIISDMKDLIRAYSK